MRKFLCLLLSVLLTVSLACPAFASEESVDPVTTSEGEGTPPDPTPTACPHSQTTGTVTTAATCSAAGTTTYTCTSCGAVTGTESIPATGVHTFGAWQSTGDSTHKRVCTGGCGTEETAAHSWDGGTVTTAATCTATGVKTYSCSCGATKTETIAIDANAHTFGEWDGNEGSHSRTCSGCGKTESGSHSWYSSKVTLAPTCQEEGIEALVCTVCGGILYEVLPVIDHAYDNPCDPDCNMCGLTRDVAHKFSTAWSKNSKEHWHTCSLCGEKTDVGSHYPGPAATEEKAQLCLTCGLTMTPKLNHTHEYESTWTSDETGHWHACDGCEDQKDLAEHVYDDPCDPDCNICGYRTNTAHSYDQNWLSDETGHWSVCTICGEQSDVIPHTPGPEATETEAQLCTVCQFELASPQKHVHEFGDWLMDEENHWKECECGEKSDEALHAWDEGTEKDGTITYICTECQAERTEEAPEEAEFPWFAIVMVLLLLVCAGAAAALILVLRKPKNAGRFTR